MIGQLGLRGISILVASGDNGLGGSCEANDETTPRFSPVFRETCPYVTVVGGTQGFGPEIAWNASGGGFSDYFEQPKYQKAWIDDYLDKVDPGTLSYLTQFINRHGRAFPDIAAHNKFPGIAAYVENQMITASGTSTSTPIVAGMIGLLNDIRPSQGKPTLGFLNPWLYSSGFESLADMVEGGAGGCNGTGLQSHQPVPGATIIPGAIWSATVRWDPVTGLGIPDFGRMREAVMKL